MILNAPTVEIYSSGTTRLPDIGGDLLKAESLHFETYYPGGLYGAASFFVARNITTYWPLIGGQRVVIRNGVTPVYEGYIERITDAVGYASQGKHVTMVGPWAWLAMSRGWRKIWSDKRITDDIWRWDTAATGETQFAIDRVNRLRIVPKAEALTSSDFAQVYYKMPTGQTAKRVTGSYNLQEGAQNYTIALYISSDGSSWSSDYTIASTSGTGTFDRTLGTPSRWVAFRFSSGASQTPTSDGTYFGEIGDVVVYGETSSINLTEIVTDVAGYDARISTYTGLIGSNTYSLTPFVNDAWSNSLADILIDAASFGDSSYNRWSVGFRHSELATTPDGKPVIFCEQYPALTASLAEYVYSYRDLQSQGLEISKDYLSVRNWITVDYVDGEGNVQSITPDDDANLTDTTSSGLYGTRHAHINAGHTTSTQATAMARRYLATAKDPQWIMDAPLSVVDSIQDSNGVPTPVCEITAGKRVRITDYPDDTPVFLITKTSYNDEQKSATLDAGTPGFFIPAELAQSEAWTPWTRPADTGGGDGEGISGGGGGSGGRERLNWKRRFGAQPGTALWSQLSGMSWKEKQTWIAEQRARRRKRG